MVEKAKVAIIEDDTDWQDIIKKQLTERGHIVVASAGTYSAALQAIATFGELGIQVVTMDGNLDPNAYSGDEGLSLVQAIRRQFPDVKIVGMSGDNHIFEGKVDVNVGKRRLGGRECLHLGDIVNTL